MRIAFAGDRHASHEAAWAAVEACHERGVDHIVHVGDFMYTGSIMDKFLRSLARATKRYDLSLSFIRGNHDSTPALRAMVKNANGRTTEEGFVPFTRHISYIPDGTQWTWEGVRLAGLGGAFSVDRAFRKEGKTFWSDEVTDPEAVRDLMATGRGTDILITHDVPEGLHIREAKENLPYGFDIPGSLANQRLIREVVDSIEPRFLISGHMHTRQTDYLRTPSGAEVYSVVLDRGDYYKVEATSRVLGASLFIVNLEDGQVKR